MRVWVLRKIDNNNTSQGTVILTHSHRRVHGRLWRAGVHPDTECADPQDAVS
jgi:hypothetical protein